MTERIKEVKCPTCGEKIKYDPQMEMNHCDACRNYYSIDFFDCDGNDDAYLGVSRCPNCGGELHYQIGTDSLLCDSCDSTFKIVDDDAESCIGLEPDYIIPFSVTEEQLKSEFIEVLASTDYVPTDVFDKVGFEYIKGYYQPYYKINVFWEADYTASVGFDRSEQYEDYETKYENGKSYRQRVIKERIVTDWHPISGHTSGNIVLWSSGIKNDKDNIFVYSPKLKEGRQTKDQSLRGVCDKIAQQAGGTGKKFNKMYLSGFAATPFSKSVSDAWDTLKNDVNTVISNQVAEQISGEHVKDIHWSGTSNPAHVDMFYIPIWVISYCYCGEFHTFITSGSDLKFNFLSKPQDTESVKKVRRFFIPLITWGVFLGVYLILGLIAIFSSYRYEIGDYLAPLLPWLLGIGFITVLFGYLNKSKHLSIERSKRNIGKERVKKDINKFFSRPASYYFSRSEKTSSSFDGEEKSSNRSTKKFALSLNNKQKRIVAIIVPIVFLTTILTVVVIRTNFKSGFSIEGNGLNNSYARVLDMADLLSESEEKALAKTLDSISERHKLDVVAVTTDNLNGKNVRDYADDVYDAANLGYGNSRDGVLLLVSVTGRNWYISTFGYGIVVFTDARLQYIGNEITSDLSGGDYASAFNTYALLCDDFIRQSKKVVEKDDNDFTSESIEKSNDRMDNDNSLESKEDGGSHNNDFCANGHSWIEATCTSPAICSVCGEMRGQPLEHSWVEATCTSPAICSVCGKTQGQPLEHSWLEATCTSPAICSICGGTSGQSLGHIVPFTTCTRCHQYVDYSKLSGTYNVVRVYPPLNYDISTFTISDSGVVSFSVNDKKFVLQIMGETQNTLGGTGVTFHFNSLDGARCTYSDAVCNIDTSKNSVSFDFNLSPIDEISYGLTELTIFTEKSINN